MIRFSGEDIKFAKIKKMEQKMNTCKTKQKRIIIIACLLVLCLAMTTVLAGALQNTPWHSHSSGIKLKTSSSFCGNVKATGKYGTKKGKYIKQAWVEIKEGGKLVRYDCSAVVKKTNKSIQFAETSCFNNPFKSQSFPYGWKYQ